MMATAATHRWPILAKLPSKRRSPSQPRETVVQTERYRVPDAEPFLGDELGAREGTELGVALGTMEATELGARLGTVEGTELGAKLGKIDGTDTGSVLRTGLGAREGAAGGAELGTV